MTPDARSALPEGEQPADDCASSSRRVLPAQITLLYESRDGRFCLFEDAQGHLSAVNAARLA